MADMNDLVKSIAHSFEVAARETLEHQMRRAELLEAKYPDGSSFKIGRTVYTRESIGSEIFWISAKRGLTSRQMAIELGTRLV